MTGADFYSQAKGLIPAEVRMISGCEDYQTSADVSNVTSKFELPDPAGRSGGACTSALLDILYEGTSRGKNQKSRFSRFRASNSASQKPLTFQDVLMKLRENLAQNGLSQIPQLTSSRPLDLQETPFHLVGGTGASRALLVGINYRGQNGQLSGCHNDVLNVKNYIQKVHGFSEENITVLMDDGAHQYPTRGRIIQALRSMVIQSVPGDSVFFHYSGHGGLLEPIKNAFKNKNSEYDQTLIPVDHQRTDQIRDFSLFNHFIQPMAAGVTVTCIMDCCHSGSVLDLPYTFKATNVGEAPRMVENVAYLSNLAFLFVLAGGILPGGFENIAGYIGDVVGGSLDDFQGTGLEDSAQDYQDAALEDSAQDYQDTGFDESAQDAFAEDVPDYSGDAMGEQVDRDFDTSCYGDGAPVVEGIAVPAGYEEGAVVQGMAVPDPSEQGAGDFGSYSLGGYDDRVVPAGIENGPVVQGMTEPDASEQGMGGYGFGGYDDQGGDMSGGDGADFDGCDPCDFLGPLLDDS